MAGPWKNSPRSPRCWVNLEGRKLDAWSWQEPGEEAAAEEEGTATEAGGGTNKKKRKVTYI